MKVNIIGVRKSFSFLTDEGFEIFVDDFKDGFAYIEISTDITYKDENVYVVALNLK